MNMKRIVIVLGAVLAAGVVAEQLAQAAADAKPAPVVKVVALSVALPDPNSKYGQSLSPSMSAGTSLYVMISSADRFFVALDEEGSKLAAFGDDKGTDLSKSDDRFGSSWTGPWTRISEDGRSCNLAVISGKTPAPGARELKLKASVLLLCGADEKKAQQKDLELKKGAKLSVGPVEAEIEQVQEQKIGSETTVYLSIKSEKSLDAVRKLTFTGADGKEIQAVPAGSSRMGILGKFVYNRSWSLKGNPAKVGVEVTYFDKVEKLQVPVEVTVGVGF